jgi:hypothetical protein
VTHFKKNLLHFRIKLIFVVGNDLLTTVMERNLFKIKGVSYAKNIMFCQIRQNFRTKRRSDAVKSRFSLFIFNLKKVRPVYRLQSPSLKLFFYWCAIIRIRSVFIFFRIPWILPTYESFWDLSPLVSYYKIWPHWCHITKFDSSECPPKIFKTFGGKN